MSETKKTTLDDRIHTYVGLMLAILLTLYVVFAVVASVVFVVKMIAP